MNADHNKRERVREMQIDAGLASYPVAPLPEGFTSQVMAQVDLTQQEMLQVTPTAIPPGSVRRYLRLYGFELACSIVLTLGLVIGLIWPLFAQAGLLPALWWGAPALDIRLALRFSDYFSSWYALGLCVVIVLELGIASLAWMAWVEPPRLKVR